MKESRLSELRQVMEAALRGVRYEEVSIQNYRHTWDRLASYMDAKGIFEYERKVGDAFLSEIHDGKPQERLSEREKKTVRHVNVLSCFQETETIPPPNYKRREIVFEGETGEPFNAFIEEEHPFKKESSITRHKERIEHLYNHLRKENRTVKELDTPCMLRFIYQVSKEKGAPVLNTVITTVRLFIRYLCSRELLGNNNAVQWMSILKVRRVHRPKIPSVYSREEVEALIGAIDRGNQQGKRDYAMILLAARYGLRISDIIGLRHCNLDWEHNRIVLYQQKTGKKVDFPLSEEVGNAIIEYLKYGRPKVTTPYIFITLHAPYKELSSNGLGMAIRKYFRLAGVNFTNRRHGPHALRHSLASNLLRSNESLPVISEILGHADTDTTMEYLRIDMNLLRQCALEVSFVPSSFYGNLYGT